MRYLLLCWIALLLISCGRDREVRTGEGTAAEDSSYMVAYNVLEDLERDDYEIYISELDGSGRKNISNHPGVDWVYYAWGGKLYFISDRDTAHRKYFLYEMNTDGSGLRRMTDFLVDDSWMGSRKQGREFIVRPLRSVNDGFFIIDRDGNVLDTLLDNPTYKNDPVFSPGGDKIVFRMRQDGIDELWVADADGSNYRQLTHYPESDTSIATYGYHAGPPRWNPEEDFISYQSKQNGKYSLYSVTLDDGNAQKLTDNEMNEGWHDWSDNGRWLAIEMFDSEQQLFDIYLMDWDNKKLGKLAATDKVEQAPVLVRKSH